MKAPSTVFVAALVVLSFSQTPLVLSRDTNWLIFAGCITSRFGPAAIINPSATCAATQMVIQFNAMNRAECINCDKYFHCKANYNAVANCPSEFFARRTAEAISNCREFSQGGTDADSLADQEANDHGRALQSCEKYLCDANCKYSPVNDTCSRENC